MDVPDLVRDRLGGEQVVAGVSLGDEDALLVTPSRALLYRGEGLLSDEAVEVFSLDVERLAVSDGRRKTKFVFETVEGTDSFSVPGTRAETVLEHLMAGILGVAEVTGGDESVAGVFRFSELTLVVTDRRLVKHVGAPVWDEDFEEFPYEAVTGLDFEEGSVATQIVLSVDGRPQRIKAPTDEAPKLRQTLQQALFGFHGVDSLEEFNDAVGDAEAPDADGSTDDSAGHLDLNDDIDPLVGGTDPEPADPGETDHPGATAEEAESSSGDGSEDTARPDRIAVDPTPESDTDDGPDTDRSDSSDGGDADVTAASEESGPTPASRDDLADVARHLSDLEAAVQQQNDLLRKQHEAIQQLISELRRGR